MPLQLVVGMTGGDDTDDQLLARIAFSKAHEIGADPRLVTIGQPAFDGCSTIECWRSERLVETGRHGEIAFVTDGRFLFGHLVLDETPGHCLEQPAHHAYTEILRLLRAFGGLQLLRIWNIVDAINEDQAGLERYRSFCVGRATALAAAGFAHQALPAASGVGSATPGLMISFIAATEPGRQIENPRQVSAFRYPREHGPKSPSFSRALLYPLSPEKSLLFVSGTASIVGHQTMHQGDLDKQFEETCRNLEAVKGAVDPACRFEALRVYVRRDEDAPSVMARCRNYFGDQLPMIPLKSAICRRELLLEIEGVASVATDQDAVV